MQYHNVRLDSISGTNLICYDTALKREVTIPYSSSVFVLSLSSIEEDAEFIQTPFGDGFSDKVINHIVFVLKYDGQNYYK